MTTTTAHHRARNSAATRTRTAATTADIAHALATTRNTHRPDPSHEAGRTPEPPETRHGHAQAGPEQGLTCTRMVWTGTSTRCRSMAGRGRCPTMSPSRSGRFSV